VKRAEVINTRKVISNREFVLFENVDGVQNGPRHVLSKKLREGDISFRELTSTFAVDEFKYATNGTFESYGYRNERSRSE
jgi:paraquat-inducible protein B